MIRMGKKFNSLLLLGIIICALIHTVESKNHGGKKSQQKTFLQSKKQSKFHTIPLVKKLPSQKYLIETMNLLKQHQALLLQMKTYSFLEINADNQIVKKEVEAQNSFLQTDTSMLKKKQGFELRNRDNTFFTGKIGIGGSDYDAIFDTGSAFVFVNSDYCQACMENHKYYTETSTLEETNFIVDVEFGSGKLSGVVSKDIINFGDIVLDKGIFAQITEQEGQIFQQNFDGIVGLSAMNLSDQLPSMLQQLFANGDLEQNMVSFFLERDELGSQLLIGGADITKYTGEIQYHDIIEGSNFWTLTCKEIRIGDENTGLCSEGNPCRLIMDSGTSFFTGPSDSVTTILQQIDKNGEGCKNLYDLPTITFVVDESEYIVYPNEYVITSTVANVDPFYEHSDIQAVAECMISFYGLDVNDTGSNDNTWILGDVFMGKYYTVFNGDTKQVGIARSVNYASYIH